MANEGVSSEDLSDTITDLATTVITYDPELAPAAVEPIVILTPNSFPYESYNAVPWNYEAKVLNPAKTEPVANIAGAGVMTRSGSPVDDRLYVAVGKDLNQSKSTLLWALHNSRGKGICILHVHEPSLWIPLMGTQFLPSQLEEHQVREYRDVEKQARDKLLQSYSLFCDEAGVQASISCIEMISIEKGIIELITQKGIRKLVMGAAADTYYSKEMMRPKSRKAIYVCQQAPSTCHIWFICKGNLVHTREHTLDGDDIGNASLNLQESQNSSPDESRFLSNHGARSEFPRIENLNLSPSVKSSTDMIIFDGWNDITGISPIASSSRDVADASSLPLQIEYHHRLSLPPSALEGGMNEELFDQLEKAIVEAEISEREAFEESMKRRKAEKDIIDVIRRGKPSENMFFEEQRRRKEAEEALALRDIELEKSKQQLNEIMEELCMVQEQKQSQEKQIVNFEGVVHELEQNVFSSIGLLQKYKNERDEFEIECEDAKKLTEELKRKQDDASSSTSMTQLWSEFALSEIEEATDYFDNYLKIEEGSYGSIFKGVLRHTQVAIKKLQVPSDFEQEVSILSKLRHPNLVTLIGACEEASALIYEYLPNGTLEDRLNCKDDTPPLSWQTRIRIASELCSVLVFLHSCNPHSISDGDINPSNIRLDANYGSKLCNFRLNRVIIQNETFKSTTFCCPTVRTEGTLAYIDPEFVDSQELTPDSDVYSFGVVLLRLLTGKSISGILNEMECAFDDGNLNNLLDHTAGDWPFVQAKQLAHLAMRCCSTHNETRPNLAFEISRVFETMLVSCGVSSSQLSSEENRHIPHYFVCPIFQEIMEDPHVAADGFTYELEALRGWLDSNHDTSPMTNLQLPNHNLVPNRALRSAIQEWQQSK